MTPGGGGDGAELIHDVLHAYQQDPELHHKALIVLGPYMPARQRRKLMKKGMKLASVKIIEFDNQMEDLVAGAKAVVAMGGYNTYCEILSFDKPALIVPRTVPARGAVDPCTTRRRTRPDRHAAAGGGGRRPSSGRSAEGPARRVRVHRKASPSCGSKA